MKKSILFFYFLFSFQTVFSIDLKTDSLRKINSSLITKQDDKCVHYLNLSNSYFFDDIAKANLYGKMALEIAEKVKVDSLIHRSYYAMAYSFLRLNNMDSSLFYFRKSLPFINFENKEKNKYKEGFIFLGIGSIYTHLLNFDSSLYYYNKSEKSFIDSKNLSQIAGVKSNIAYILSNQGKNKEAINMLLDALNKYSPNSNLKSHIYSQLAYLSYEIKKYESAIFYYSKVLSYLNEIKDYYRLSDVSNNVGRIYLETHNLDSALFYFTKSDIFYQKHKKDGAKNPDVLSGIASVYKAKGNYLSAKKIILEAIKNIENPDNSRSKIEILILASEIHLQLKEYKEAKKYIDKIEREVDKKENYESILNLKYSYFKGVENLDSAILTMEKLMTFRDNLSKMADKKAMADILVKYQTNEKQKKIELLNLKNQQSEKEKAQQKKIVLGIGIGLVGTIAVIIFIIVLLRKSKKQKNTLQQAYDKNNILMKEIHHRVKNNLQMISTLLELQSKNSQNKEALEILKSGQNRVKSIALIHQKLYQNEDVSKVDFKEYAEQLVNYITNLYEDENRKINVNLTIAPEFFVDIDQAIPLSLILNELLTNSYKYAFPIKNKGNIIIKLVKINNQFCFEYSDDGQGFSFDSLEQKEESLGMKLIRILSRQLQGEAEWKTVNQTVYILKFEDVVIEKAPSPLNAKNRHS